MPSTGAIRAGRAFVELFADGSQVVATLKNVEKRFQAFGKMVSGWGKSLSGIGAAITAPMIAASKSWADAGYNLQKLHEQTGISVEALSSLGYAAKESMTDTESLASGLQKMEKFLNEAAGGSKEAGEALAAMGLTLEDLQGKSPDEQFKLIAEGMSHLTSQSQKTAVAMAVFGKGGADLLPLLNKGGKGIAELQQQAEEMGIVMSGPAAQAATDLHMAYEKMGRAVAGIWRSTGAVIAPIMKQWADAVTGIASGVKNFIKAHKDAVVIAFAIGAALVAAGTALYVFGTAMVWAVGAVGAIGTALATVWGFITAIGGAIATVLTSPLLLAIGVVVGLAGAFLYMSGAAGKAVGWLGARFGELKDMATEAFQGIASALLAGDIELAAKIVWTILKMAWQTGIHALEGMWLGFKLNFIEAAYGMYFGAQAAFELLTHWLTIAWVETIAALKSGWATFTGWYHAAVEGLANWIAKRWVDVQAIFDDSIDAEQQKSDIDKDSDNAMGDINKQEQNDKARIESDRQAQLKGEQADHDANMAQIGDAYQAAIDKAKAKYEAARGGDQTELDNLKAQYKALLEQAKNAKKPDAALGSAGAAPTSPDDFGSGLKNAAKTTGTFSAAAAQGMFGGSTQDHIKRTAIATEAIAKAVKNPMVHRAIVRVG